LNFSINDINLKSIPFSRQYSRIRIFEMPVEQGSNENGLFITYSVNAPTNTIRFNLIQIIPEKDGKPLPYTYKADPGSLKIIAGGGEVEVCYDGREILRFRAQGGIDIVFKIKFQTHEQFLDRLDGTAYAAFTGLGEFLFEQNNGAQTYDSKWMGLEMKSADTNVKWTPDADGRIEGYIHHADSFSERPDVQRDFDICVKENLRDFSNWCDKYENVPEKYAHIRLLSIYVIWISMLGKGMLMSDDMVVMTSIGPLPKAMGWQQGYHAMAIYKDIDQAVRFMHSMFICQDKYGEIPDGITDRLLFWANTKPPFQGFALMYILDMIGMEALTKEHCELLYLPMCRWVDWWLTFRDRNNDGIAAYNHADESGWDDASIFCKGLPLATPDLAALLILCMEACSKLAEKLGYSVEAEEWMERSKAMLQKMIEVFWNGEKFICVLDKTGEVVDEESIAVYQPIILGKRLPQEIIEKIAATISNPEMFYTEDGFTSESMKSRHFDTGSGAFVLGVIGAPMQLLLTVGLYNAGCKELALKNAYNWCEKALAMGPQTSRRDLYTPTPPPFEGYIPIFSLTPLPGCFSSWGPAVFLVLGQLLYNDLEERSR